MQSSDLPNTVKSRCQKMVCHCLRISHEDIEQAIQSGSVQTVKCVIRKTKAGSGCTACHCTIRKMLAEAGLRNNTPPTPALAFAGATPLS